MGLTTLPKRISGSLGATKVDLVSKPYSTGRLPAGEWNTSAQAVEDVCDEVGLSNGGTSGSLVARVKEFFKLDGSTLDQFSGSTPSANNGFINPHIQSVSSNDYPVTDFIEVCADGVTTASYNSATWWYTGSIPFRPSILEFTTGLGVSGSLPANGPGEFIMLGVVFCGSDTYLSGITYINGYVSGSSGNNEPSTWLLTGDGPGTGSLFFTSSVGAYYTKNKIEIIGTKPPLAGPAFSLEVYSRDVVGQQHSLFGTSGMIGSFTSSAWVSSSCNKIGITLFGNYSNPVTLSISDFRLYPRPGDGGAPLI